MYVQCLIQNPTLLIISQQAVRRRRSGYHFKDGQDTEQGPFVFTFTGGRKPPRLLPRRPQPKPS